MVALISVQADHLTACNGVTRLSAGRHTLVAGAPDCADCQIVGEPGAVLDAQVECGGLLSVNGAIEVRGRIRSYGGVAVRGNVTFKDCLLTADFWKISGPNSGEHMVSFTNCTAGNRAEIDVSNGARVRFTDFTSEGYDENNYLTISDSHATFERAAIFIVYEGYEFKNSTVIVSDSTFTGDHTKFVASNSFLNLTNSIVHVGGSNFDPSISISGCSVKATCGKRAAVFESHGYTSMDIVDSTLSFGNCSCALDHAISEAFDVPGKAIRNSSTVAFSSCRYGGFTKTEAAVVVV